MSEDGGRDGDGSVFARDIVEPTELAFQPTWVHRKDLKPFSPVDGISMQTLTGGRLMLNWVTFEPNRVVPRHQHPHEQGGIVIEGTLELTIGDDPVVLRPGDGYVIPPDLPHSAASGAEGCLVLDIFSPPREDYVGRG